MRVDTVRKDGTKINNALNDISKFLKNDELFETNQEFFGNTKCV